MTSTPVLPPGGSGKEKAFPVPTMQVALRMSMSTRQTTRTRPGGALHVSTAIHYQRGRPRAADRHSGEWAATAGLAVIRDPRTTS
jgi:hypothetical protein